MKRVAGILSLLLQACGAPHGTSNLPPTVEDLGRDAETTGVDSYGNLLKALALDEDPAQPTGHLRDEKYRSEIQEALNARTEKLACRKVETIAMLSSATTYQALVRFETSTLAAQAVLIYPKGFRSLPVTLFVGSGLASPKVEALGLFENEPLVLALPVLAGDAMTWPGRDITESADGSEAWLAEADRAYALMHCLQRKASEIVLDGNTLADIVRPAGSELPGPQTLVAGVGRGALVASLMTARSGAWALAGRDEAQWVHVSHGILVNPQWSVMIAESRLLLQALVRGNTEETRYKFLPGVVSLRREVFAPLREGTLSHQAVAFSLLLRDGLMMAPWIDLALKDFSRPSGDKGPPAGNLLVLHAEGRTDHAVNLSRVFANVATTVRFETQGATNGMNLVYREFDDLDASSSYLSMLPETFFRSRSHPLANSYVRPSDPAQAVLYRSWILGEGFPARQTPVQAIHDFLVKRVSNP